MKTTREKRKNVHAKFERAVSFQEWAEAKPLSRSAEEVRT